MAVDLDEKVRKGLQGNPLSFYTDAFQEVREIATTELKKMGRRVAFFW
jgi:hypothetical protein